MIKSSEHIIEELNSSCSSVDKKQQNKEFLLSKYTHLLKKVKFRQLVNQLELARAIYAQYYDENREDKNAVIKTHRGQLEDFEFEVFGNSEDVNEALKKRHKLRKKTIKCSCKCSFSNPDDVIYLTYDEFCGLLYAAAYAKLCNRRFDWHEQSEIEIQSYKTTKSNENINNIKSENLNIKDRQPLLLRKRNYFAELLRIPRTDHLHWLIGPGLWHAFWWFPHEVFAVYAFLYTYKDQLRNKRIDQDTTSDGLVQKMKCQFELATKMIHRAKVKMILEDDKTKSVFFKLVEWNKLIVSNQGLIEAQIDFDEFIKKVLMASTKYFSITPL